MIDELWKVRVVVWGLVVGFLAGCSCPEPRILMAADLRTPLTGIEVVKITTPKPLSLEQAAPLKRRGDAVFLLGGLVLRGASGGLVVGQFTESGTKLMERGVLYLPDAASDVVAVDGFAYVACGAQGVFIVDLSDPRAPVSNVKVRTGGAALRMDLKGNRLLVANGTGGVVVLDITDRLKPVPVAAWRSEGYVRHAVFTEDGVIAAEGFEGITMLTEDGKGGMNVEWKAKTAGQARAVVVSGKQILVADGPAGISVLRMDTEEGTVCEGTFALEDMVRDVALGTGGDRVYVAVGDDGIIVIDITDPKDMKQTGSYVPGKPANRIRVDRDRLLVGNDSDGLLVLSVESVDELRKVFPVDK